MPDQPPSAPIITLDTLRNKISDLKKDTEELCPDSVYRRYAIDKLNSAMKFIEIAASNDEESVQE